MPTDNQPTTTDVRQTPPLRLANGDAVSVVHLAGELFPYARTGGLGEAVNNLASYQAASGLDVAIIMPLYRQVLSTARDLEPVGEAFTVTVGPRVEEARIYQERPRADAPAGQPRVYFVANKRYFDRDGLYGEGGGDYPDNARRFAFFCLAAITALPRLTKAPVIVHAHDWHTALAPVYMRTFGRNHPFYKRASTVLSVHNAGFQGHFPTATMADIGLPWDLYNFAQLEWYGRVNLLKGGLAFSDAVVTVSPTHAHELRTPFGGFGLHDMFIALGNRFVGIANGIDQQLWDPTNDPYITSHFSQTDLAPKRRNKGALQRTFGLTQRAVPIFAMSARLTYQKGLDLILGFPDYFALDAQFIFLGAGEPRYMEALTEIAARAPGRIACEFNFTERLEHRLIAGADMCLMPSQYEPCGLTQMRAQRYGTIPVARRVGGLADTIEDGVTGFLFDGYTSEDFMGAAVRALSQFQKKTGWQAMQREAMSRDFGWDKSGRKYLELYRRVVGAPVEATTRVESSVTLVPVQGADTPPSVPAIRSPRASSAPEAPAIAAGAGASAAKPVRERRAVPRTKTSSKAKAEEGDKATKPARRGAAKGETTPAPVEASGTEVGQATSGDRTSSAAPSGNAAKKERRKRPR